MEKKDSSIDAATAARLLNGMEVPVFSVLESQMGDPVLSHWVGKDGIVAGTAMGRVSAYIFSSRHPTSAGKMAAYASKEVAIEHFPLPEAQTHNDSPSDFVEIDASQSVANEETLAMEKVPRRSSSSSEAVSSVELESNENANDDVLINFPTESDEELEATKEDNSAFNPGRFQRIALLCSRIVDHAKCRRKVTNKPKIDGILPGMYTVFASFSDEAVRAVFIHNRMLYAMVGTSSIAVYDVDQYVLKNEYRLSLSRNTGYKQITFSNCKILVDCMRGSTILDPVERKQISSSHRVYPSNVLDFNGSDMLCYYRNINKYFVHVVSLETESSKKVVFSMAMPKNVYLVTHGKFWNPGRLVVVTDMLTISVFKYQEMEVTFVRRKMRVDIVAVCGGFSNFLAVLQKDATLKLLHPHTLDTFFSIPLSPATFDLGWPYTLMNYKNVVSFTSDEGVYCLKIPRKILKIARKWKMEVQEDPKHIHQTNSA